MSWNWYWFFIGVQWNLTGKYQQDVNLKIKEMFLFEFFLVVNRLPSSNQFGFYKHYYNWLIKQTDGLVKVKSIFLIELSYFRYGKNFFSRMIQEWIDECIIIADSTTYKQVGSVWKGRILSSNTLLVYALSRLLINIVINCFWLTSTNEYTSVCAGFVFHFVSIELNPSCRLEVLV